MVSKLIFHTITLIAFIAIGFELYQSEKNT